MMLSEREPLPVRPFRPAAPIGVPAKDSQQVLFAPGVCGAAPKKRAFQAMIGPGPTVDQLCPWLVRLSLAAARRNPVFDLRPGVDLVCDMASTRSALTSRGLARLAAHPIRL